VRELDWLRVGAKKPSDIHTSLMKKPARNRLQMSTYCLARWRTGHSASDSDVARSIHTRIAVE